MLPRLGYGCQTWVWIQESDSKFYYIKESPVVALSI